jgi:hypothetical protein
MTTRITKINYRNKIIKNKIIKNKIIKNKIIKIKLWQQEL